MDRIVINFDMKRIAHDPSTENARARLSRSQYSIEIWTISLKIDSHIVFLLIVTWSRDWIQTFSWYLHVQRSLQENPVAWLSFTKVGCAGIPRRGRLDMDQRDTDALCRTLYLMKRMKLTVGNQQECHLNKWSRRYLRKRFVMLSRSSVKMSRANFSYSTSEWSMIKGSVNSVATLMYRLFLHLQTCCHSLAISHHHAKLFEYIAHPSARSGQTINSTHIPWSVSALDSYHFLEMCRVCFWRVNVPVMCSLKFSFFLFIS